MAEISKMAFGVNVQVFIGFSLVFLSSSAFDFHFDWFILVAEHLKNNVGFFGTPLY
jgi:hypothetical protein